MTNEHRRLDEARAKENAWKKWGPYLSERQWGTVREDYSEDGNAWNYFTHDQARSRAYRLHCADHSGKRSLPRRTAQRAESRETCHQNGHGPDRSGGR
jgi:hypothetical protein